MKKSLTVIIALLVLCAVVFSGCSAPEDGVFELDDQKLVSGIYTFATRMVDGDQAIEYDTVYVVSRFVDKDGKNMIRIESSGEREGEKIYSCNELYGEAVNELTVFTPVKISMEYRNEKNSQSDVLVNVEHKHSDNKLVISLQRYENGKNEMSKSDYTVITGKQYYDSETLPFIIGCLPLADRPSINFTLSSSNRDALQSMNLTVVEETVFPEINGEEVECYAVVLRPNTMFTHFATTMYYRVSDQCLVGIVQDGNVNNNVSFFLRGYAELPAEE